MAEQEEQEEMTVLAWYDASRSIFIDLVGDYAGKELFLIEGDSLLRECFGDERLDFQGGFQMLHAVFLVESFLENLVKRHCQFHIAFFKEHQELCIPANVPTSHRSRYLLTRMVVIQHLFTHLNNESTVQVHVFPSLQSTAFDRYLSNTPIHFFMAHDGKVPGKNEDNEADLRAMILLRSGIYWFTTQSRNPLNVALINRIEFRDSKIFTMIIEGRYERDIVPRFTSEVEETWDKFNKAEVEEIINPKDIREWLGKLSMQSCLTGEDGEVSEKWYLTACSICIALSRESDTVLASAFVFHALLIEHISLSQRRLPLITFEGDFEKNIEKFLEKYAAITTSILDSKDWAATMNHHEITPDLVDIVDGRLFRAVIQALLEGSLETSMPEVVKRDWVTIEKVIKSVTDKTLSLKSISDSDIPRTIEELRNDENIDGLSVMPFSHLVFDKHLECIHVTPDASLVQRLGTMKLYRETHHWHNHKKPLNPKHAAPEKVSKWKNPLRTNQFYMAEMTSYAASLTGAKGKALEPETITVGVKKLLKPADEKPSKTEKLVSKEDPGNKKGSKKGATGLTKAQQIIADNKEKKGGAETDKAYSAWIGVMKVFDELSSDQEKYLRAKSYLDGLDSAKASHVEGDIKAYLLQTLLSWWGKYCKVDKKVEGYHVVALIWPVVRSMSASNSPISKEIHQHVEKICKLVGITDAMTGAATLNASDRKLSFSFKYPLLPEGHTLRIGLPQIEFQVLHCGPYMDRLLDAKSDARVSGFVPDGWQRKVLDELDANNSVFVVAPTSAGKTFISFYAMEKVLRANNDSVLVYVAPTKALVNQIAAEVQGRFSKKYPMAGKSVWAIHTRDYRVNNPTGCQILVTVPHILQIMLLAPTNAKSWAPRVKRIIFDEIHSIGNAEDGVVWEQLLLLAPCPIIALSATIGNPSEFSGWLNETQKANNIKLAMIQHSTRYSDLRKYLYEPPKTFRFEGLGKSHGVGLGLDGLTGLTYFHPVASLVDKSRGMPDDLSLEPRDCFFLWQAMVKCQTEKFPVPSKLNPINCLPPCIKKADIFQWEKELKKVLLHWMSEDTSPFVAVVKELTPNTPILEGQIKKDADEASSDRIDRDDLKATTLPLLYQLHQRQALPAILFNYDRTGCEDIATTLLKQLKDAEDDLKRGKEWQRKIDGWTKWKELKDKRGAKKAPKASKKKGGDDDDKTSKADQVRDEANSETSLYDLFDPEAPQDGFTFADKKKCQPSELDDYLRQLRWKHIREDLIELLQRGIGVHHSGMNRKYRQCVEMLFRKGFLRVVVATGTLSLGINMPCATVVFSGDSVYLTALNFRQAAGRSGRRGFDLLGNVVFQGISKMRACRLLSSRLPDLTGHFPITTTLVLRLFTLLHDSKNSKYAVDAVNALLSQPRLYMGGESFKEQVLHHLRFSIEYLRRMGLLGPHGEPVNFTSCVSHLYYTENSSFAFHALLKDGYFAKLCADIDTKPETTMHTMMVVLSHLFGRRAIAETSDEAKLEKIRRSSSMVYLPDLPKDAEAVLKKHNDETLEIFSTYVKTFAAQHAGSDETVLPLTGVTIGLPALLVKDVNGNGKSNGSATSQKSRINPSFLPIAPSPHARSLFVALSGYGDTFTTITDLCTSTRHGIFLESAVIPFVPLPSESRTPLNAYLLDYYIHGSVAALESANGIRRSDVWFVLNDFSLVLATIVASLGTYLGLGIKGDDEMLDVMGSGDAAENEVDEEFAAVAAPTTATTDVAPVTAPAAANRKSRKTVAEDWGDDEDKLNAADQAASAGGSGIGSISEDKEYDALMNVYRAFKMLKGEFDGKFRKMWA